MPQFIKNSNAYQNGVALAKKQFDALKESWVSELEEEKNNGTITEAEYNAVMKNLKSVNDNFESVGKDYLENMLKYNKDFSNVQEKILQETGDYPKTRYGIITFSLKHLIDSNDDFRDLLLFVSLSVKSDRRHQPKLITNHFIKHLQTVIHNPLSRSAPTRWSNLSRYHITFTITFRTLQTPFGKQLSIKLFWTNL